MKNEKDLWTGYLKELRHDAIAKQRNVIPAESDIECLGRVLYDVTSFAETARTYGLLAVEEESLTLDRQNEQEALLYEGVKLVIDGRSPEQVAEILTNIYWVRQPEGYAAAVSYIVIRSVLLLQEGEHPYTIRQLAASMLPVSVWETCMEICERYEAKKKKSEAETARVYFETDFSRCDSLEVREALDLLERELSFMTDREIQRLLRDVDNNYLVQALVGMRKKARQIIARNMSSRLREMIMQDCYQCADIDDCAIAEGAVHVADKLEVLQACGEILDAESRILYR